MAAPAFARHHAADDLGAVGDGALHVIGRLRAGEALADDLGIAVDEDRHQAAFLPATSITLAAACASVWVKVTGTPCDMRILRASSPLVPAARTISGTRSPSSLQAAAMPSATVSQRRMPPP